MSEKDENEVTNFTHYVTFKDKITRRIPRDVMENWLREYENHGTLALGCWELRVSPEFDFAIEMRLSPNFEPGAVDTNWRYHEHTFWPDI